MVVIGSRGEFLTDHPQNAVDEIAVERLLPEIESLAA